MMTDNNKKQIFDNDELLGLMRSHRWSLRRKRRTVAASALATLLLAALVLPSVWQTSAPLSLSQKSPLVASSQPVESVSVTEVCHETAPASNPVVLNKVVSHLAVATTANDNAQNTAESLSDMAESIDQASLDLFAEIMTSEYTTILWNDGSEADSVVSRLHQLLNKKDA